MESWTVDEVCQWLSVIKIDDEVQAVFRKEKMDGKALCYISDSDLKDYFKSVPFGARMNIITEKKRYLENEKKNAIVQIGGATSQGLDQTIPKFVDDSPTYTTLSESMRPFDQKVDLTFKYKFGACFLESPSGPNDLITPVHRYVHMEKITSDGDTLGQFVSEMVKFASSCLNDRTNGTIHFGVRNGKVFGSLVNREEHWAITRKVTAVMKKAFNADQIDTVLSCVRPPKFIQVVPIENGEERYVVEIDIKPSSTFCKDDAFFTMLPSLKPGQKMFNFEKPTVFR